MSMVSIKAEPGVLADGQLRNFRRGEPERGILFIHQFNNGFCAQPFNKGNARPTDLCYPGADAVALSPAGPVSFVFSVETRRTSLVSSPPPENFAFVLSLLTSVIVPAKKFIFGEPRNPATNSFAGFVNSSIGAPTCITSPSFKTTILSANVIAST